MKLYVVGFGPGNEDGMTAEAKRVLGECELIVGYRTYTELIRKYFPGKSFYDTGMRGEKERCRYAVEKASEGVKTAVVCSGDAGVYGMASLAFEIAGDTEVDIEVIPGVSAAMSGAALAGAPLSDDFAVISLSDLLTPHDVILKRIEAAAAADFAICIYNPSSKTRSGHLKRACDIILKYRDKSTVCAVVKNIGREGESAVLVSLEKLGDTETDMRTTVFIGNSRTRKIKNKMVTPRGYKL
ncbi:MAG TPA: precorrin-3B C(17)-methyltransferase [Candidatus Ornithomonoglobus intestinigallinarum]|uniref:Precorrin-3B C(17)-methyltransferase n=1 Tax=Candidatus Ornithomonoglobus intestinigallinarum TaxID=2840894 RepID=A0A9D1H4I8_9FIRM|nr:precorrin-3B C(17)-methyltransferase [Candidatus Ornithomonoglobus intestinigallinarum]